ncbi:hypothetical protein ACB094_03G135200 [Castanea mollissima]
MLIKIPYMKESERKLDYMTNHLHFYIAHLHKSKESSFPKKGIRNINRLIEARIYIDVPSEFVNRSSNLCSSQAKSAKLRASNYYQFQESKQAIYKHAKKKKTWKRRIPILHGKGYSNPTPNRNPKRKEF